MNSDQRTALIRLGILRTLADCGSYLLPEPALITSLELAAAPPPTRVECQAQMDWLDSNGYIAGVNPELGGPRKWKITDSGRALLGT